MGDGITKPFTLPQWAAVVAPPQQPITNVNIPGATVQYPKSNFAESYIIGETVDLGNNTMGVVVGEDHSVYTIKIGTDDLQYETLSGTHINYDPPLDYQDIITAVLAVIEAANIDIDKPIEDLIIEAEEIWLGGDRSLIVPMQTLNEELEKRHSSLRVSYLVWDYAPELDEGEVWRLEKVLRVNLRHIGLEDFTGVKK